MIVLPISSILSTVIGTTLVIIQAAGVFAAGHAIMRNRTTQGTIAWAISLLTLPIVALPLYLLFGLSRFEGYVELRRRGAMQILGLSESVLRAIQSMYADRSRVPPDLQLLESLAKLPFSHGNDVRLLINGEATFADIFAGIRNAREYVLIEFFIIKDDTIGRAFADLLIDMARKGVRVYLLFDEIGSNSLPRRYIRRLREAGIFVDSFGSERGPRTSFGLRLNFRNHRKIVVVDGKKAWVGGHNIGDEYLGRSSKFGQWRDTHVSVTGPAVLGIQEAFAEDFNWAAQHVPRLNWTPEAAEKNYDTLIIPTGPADRQETCLLAYVHLINTARKRLWFHSPYFAPDEQLVAALQLAALRGVDVRIMLPERPDHLLVWFSSFYYTSVDSLRDVRFYRYMPGFLHSKALLVDDDLALVGTANLDNRSMRINFEIGVLTRSEEFAAEVERMMLEDFSNSREATEEEYEKRPFLFKLAVRSARLLAPVQ